MNRINLAQERNKLRAPINTVITLGENILMDVRLLAFEGRSTMQLASPLVNKIYAAHDSGAPEVYGRSSSFSINPTANWLMTNAVITTTQNQRNSPSNDNFRFLCRGKRSDVENCGIITEHTKWR